MQIDQIITYLIAIVYIFTVIAVVYNVIMENKNPIKTLAWIIIIITIPILGFIFYANLGVNYRKRKMFSRKSIGDIKWLKYMNEKNRQFVKKSTLLDSKELCDVKKLITLLLNNSKAMLTLHNKVDILNNGSETFPAIFDSIKNAKKYIHIEYYIIEEGELANKLKELLIEKVKNGVKVRFIYDDVGSWSLSKSYVSELREAGVSIYAFSPVKFWHFKNNYRNHRKIIVVDGDSAFVGGLNFADRYLVGVPGLGIWRDIHLKVQGGAVTSLGIIFLIDWYFVCQELLLDKQNYLPHRGNDSNVSIQTVASGPDSDWASIQQAYFSMIHMAKRNVYISTPYFMPGETTLNALKTAAMSGVDVKILLPKKSDSLLTYWCTRSYVAELLEAGVKVHWYEKGFNHSKVILIDDLVASVGTANMDIRSFEQNFEVNLIIYNNDFVKQLTCIINDDFRNSRLETESSWILRKRKARIKESLARLFAPLL